MRDFQLKVLTAEKTFYDGPCVSLTIPTLDGLYGIMAGHEDLVLAVVPGMLCFTIFGNGWNFQNPAFWIILALNVCMIAGGIVYTKKRILR